jgi:hypothetical protein
MVAYLTGILWPRADVVLSLEKKAGDELKSRAFNHAVTRCYPISWTKTKYPLELPQWYTSPTRKLGPIAEKIYVYLSTCAPVSNPWALGAAVPSSPRLLAIVRLLWELDFWVGPAFPPKGFETWISTTLDLKIGVFCPWIVVRVILPPVLATGKLESNTMN